MPGEPSTGAPPTSNTTPGSGGGFVVDGEGPILVPEPEPDIAPEDQLVEGKVCNSQEVAFTKQIPTVMLLLDRSTSMFAPNLPNGGSPSPFGSFDDRWEALRAAVAGLEQYADEVQIGAATFTGYNEQNGGVCPELQGLDMQIATGNFGQVLELLPDSQTALPPSKSETPTAEALEEAVAALTAVEVEGPKYLVLVTDGLPELCHPDLLDKGNWCGHDSAFAVVQQAYAAGVTTHVIGIIGAGQPEEEAAADYFLNGIAHAGQGLELAPPLTDLHCIQQESTLDRGAIPDNDFYTNWRPWAAATYGEDTHTYADTLYFAPTDGDALGTELASVVASTRSCSFEMDEAVVRAQADKGAVRVELTDGTARDLVFGDANGWGLDPDNDYTVVISGTSCTEIQSDLIANIQIQFPCEVRVPRVR